MRIVDIASSSVLRRLLNLVRLIISFYNQPNCLRPKARGLVKANSRIARTPDGLVR